MSPWESSVSYRRVSTLIYAGWLPLRRDFRVGVDRRFKVERDQLDCNVIAHKSAAGHSQTLADTECVIRTSVGSQPSRMANDQHQPASSRAIATLATTERFLRSSNLIQRSCRRRLAVCPRARPPGSPPPSARADHARAGRVLGDATPLR
jgi:hypothetical protein